MFNPFQSSTIRRAFAILLVAGACSFGAARTAKADPVAGKWVKFYQVQVLYNLFDTHYYRWSTVFESENYIAAQWVYQQSIIADENGNLNDMWPDPYWRYVAVDVRFQSVWKFVPGTQTEREGEWSKSDYKLYPLLDHPFE